MTKLIDQTPTVPPRSALADVIWVSTVSRAPTPVEYTKPPALAAVVLCTMHCDTVKAEPVEAIAAGANRNGARVFKNWARFDDHHPVARCISQATVMFRLRLCLTMSTPQSRTTTGSLPPPLAADVFAKRQPSNVTSVLAVTSATPT